MKHGLQICNKNHEEIVYIGFSTDCAFCLKIVEDENVINDLVKERDVALIEIENFNK